MTTDLIPLIFMFLTGAITVACSLITARVNRRYSVGWAILASVVALFTIIGIQDKRGGLYDAALQTSGVYIILSFFVLVYHLDNILRRFRDMRNTIDSYEGGAKKRLSENIELLELIKTEAPQILAEKPWVSGWFKSQDSYLRAMRDLGLEGERAKCRGKPSREPRGV